MAARGASPPAQQSFSHGSEDREHVPATPQSSATITVNPLSRPLKYEKYAEKGKPEKLEKAMEKQRAKLQKATDKGKPQEYLMYKAEKIEFTQKMWTLAHLVANMKRAGFLPQC